MICCIQCFADEWLKDFIRRRATPLHTCDFCHSEEVAAVEVSRLTPFFRNLMGLYISGDEGLLGQPISELVQEDWGVFDEVRLDENKRAQLLSALLEGDVSPEACERHLSEFYFRSEAILSMEARVPDPEDHGAFAQTVEDLKEVLRPSRWPLKAGSLLYRARAGYELDARGIRRIPYEGRDIGAPPPGVAPPGRANRAGVPALYCATEEATAIAEKRPARGALLSVCSLTLTRDAELVDIAERVRRPNPFTSLNPTAKYIAWQRCKHFASEMSRPLERDDDFSSYKGPQNFVTAVQRCGYDGIRYRSALAPTGSNVVLFEPAIASIGPSQLVRVTSVQMTYEYSTAVIDPAKLMIDAIRTEIMLRNS